MQTNGQQRSSSSRRRFHETPYIFCAFCGTQHDIAPLSSDETQLFRLMRTGLKGGGSKKYFCDSLCYYRSTAQFHPTGYRPMPRSLIVNDMELMSDPAHSRWRPVQWLVEAFEKSNGMADDAVVHLPKDDEIVEKAMEEERKRLEEADALRGGNAYTGPADDNDYNEQMYAQVDPHATGYFNDVTVASGDKMEWGAE